MFYYLSPNVYLNLITNGVGLLLQFFSENFLLLFELNPAWLN